MRVQIGIDDLCPRQSQSFELWENVDTLINAGLKVDLFVTFGMVRDQDGPYYLSDHFNFVDRLHEVSDIPGVALNVHGFHHSSVLPDGRVSNNDEFLYTGKEQLEERLNLIEHMIVKTGLDFKPVFRPPAWKISQDGVDLLVKHGYTHLSLISGVPTCSHIYQSLDLSKIKVHWCNSSPPDIPLCDGDLATTYHFTTSLKNAITKENVDLFLQKISDPQPYNIFET